MQVSAPPILARLEEIIHIFPEQNLVSSIPTKKKKATSFLSLPRELRQVILLQSFGRHDHPPPYAPSFRSRLKYIKDWADTLREVDLRLHDDVDYLEKKVTQRVQKAMLKAI